MDWLVDLAEYAESRSTHAYLLHVNVADVFEFEDRLLGLEDMLMEAAPLADADVVVFWNRGTGFNFPTSEHREMFAATLNVGTKTENMFATLMMEQLSLPTVLSILTRYLQASFDAEQLEALELKRPPRVALVFEHAETIVPPSSAASSQGADRMALVTFQKWSRDMNIRAKGHSLVFVASALEMVDTALADPTSGIATILVDLPDAGAREATINRADVSIAEEMSTTQLAHLTAGLPTRSITEILELARHQDIALTPDGVFIVKKKLIEEQSGGMLEIMRPKWPLEIIGGLEGHKQFLLELAESMHRQDTLGVPQGVLLMGPPGTGKTVLAEVLASVADVPLIKLNDIRSMWVGESERNMTLALHIIERMAPAIVFMDEMDQQQQARGTAFHGDSGVSSRISGKLFEFMSDTSLRGLVVWLAATNRPSHMDPALLREGRFDDKLPFVPPDAEERARIFPALLEKMRLHAERYEKPFEWEITEAQFTELGERTMLIVRSDETVEWYQPGEKRPNDPMKRVDMTGGEIEALLGAAYRHRKKRAAPVLTYQDVLEELEQFLLSRDIRAYHEMTKEALWYAGSLRFIPEHWQKHAKQMRASGRGISVETSGTDEDGSGLYL